MTDAPELSAAAAAVACPTCPQQIDYGFRTRMAFSFFFFFFSPFLTPSGEDRWIFSPCFLVGDGSFPESVASPDLFKCVATAEHL